MPSSRYPFRREIVTSGSSMRPLMHPLAFLPATLVASPVRIVRALAVLVIALSLSAVWLDARKNHYVPCVENCGEDFLVFKYVQNYRLYGFKYGLLEDYATDPD